MVNSSYNSLTSAKVWFDYTPEIEVANHLEATLIGLVRSCGLDPDMFTFQNLYLPLSKGIYAFASVKSFSGFVYELSWDGGESYMFFTASEAEDIDGWCFKVKLPRGEKLKLAHLLDCVGGEFLVDFANLLTN